MSRFTRADIADASYRVRVGCKGMAPAQQPSEAQVTHPFPSRVYIASASSNRECAATLARALRRRGTTVTSTWHDGPAYDRRAEHALPPDEQLAIARRCVEEIKDAGALLLIDHHEARGALFEAGVAFGLGIPIEWMATPTTLFASLAHQEDPHA